MQRADFIPTGCGVLLKVVGTGYKQILSYSCQAIFVSQEKMANQKTGKPGAPLPSS
jgi:hypothetical protein